jgi:type I restriction enzyme R subunit
MSNRAEPPGAPSNFSFLRVGWPDLCLEAAKAERLAIADPRTSCFYARRCLELTWLYDADAPLRRPYKNDLSAMLFEPTFKTTVEKRIRTKMDLIRREGNAAVHRRQAIHDKTSLAAVRELFHVLFWLGRTYGREEGQVPPAELRFDSALIPRPPTKEQREQGREALRRKATENAARDAELEQARRSSEELQAELDRLRAEIAVAKAANAVTPDEHDYDEEETRDRYIDVLLSEAGWPLDQDRDREFEVTGMPNHAGKGYVDYVLWGDDGLPLGLVEAKRTRRDAKVGRQQGKLYADRLEQRFGRRPVIFYSNGYETWLWDDERYPPRQVQGFYTKDELALLVLRRSSRKPLASAEISDRIVERAYQHRAVRRIAEAFERDRLRGALIVMATGAGKTRTTIGSSAHSSLRIGSPLSTRRSAPSRRISPMWPPSTL